MNFKDIIKEEVQNILNEAFIMSDDRFHFRQRLNNSLFYGYELFTNDYDTDVTESDIIVTWKVSFWLNNMGIENLVVDVEKVEGAFTLKLLDKQTDELIEETPKNIQDFEWKFVVGDANLAKGGALYISDLTFDFKSKTCQVAF